MARDVTLTSQRSVAAAKGTTDERAAAINERVEQDKTLPLPGWLVKVYFIFPIVLYLPDAIFIYFVYSDGAVVPRAPLLLQIAQVTLWGFMAVGVVGMAYLLSVLAPWHWGQGHRVQAIFCGLGVIVATGITTWNSLAFRSTGFQAFRTDQWVWQSFPQLSGISLTMILVAVAPPFWGLFWAIVQPTQTGRSLRQIRESHAERLLRLEQEAELKRLRAESNAKVRAAQLRSMAQTAAAARQEASQLFTRKKDGTEEDGSPSDAQDDAGGEAPEGPEDAAGGRVVQLSQIKAMGGREAAGSRGGAVLMNHAAATTPTVRAAPNGGARLAAAQPPLLKEADAQRSPAAAQGDPMPWGGPRRPATPGGGIAETIFGSFDSDQMTGTTGPRPAVRRPGDNNTLSRAISGDLLPGSEAVVEEVFKELQREHNPDGSKRSLPKKEFTARVMQRLKVDEAIAQKAIDRWSKSRKSARSSGSH
jgi:hypothetical protein